MQLIYSQKDQIDSLSVRSYENLESLFKESESDSIKKLFAKIYLQKAKITNDTLKIADGYNFLSEAHSHSIEGLKFADSIIGLKLNRNKYPAEGYLQKGIQLYYLAKYPEALENFLIANDYFLNQNNDFEQLRVKHYIGLLKNAVNEEEEALSIFKQNLDFFNKEENQVNYRKQYLKSLFALTDSYNRNKKLDSAKIIGTKGINESLHTKDHYLYPFFLISYGITINRKGEFNKALDSLIKGSKLITNKKKALCDSYIIIGEIYKKNNEKDLSLKYLKKIDSIYKESPQVIFEAKNAYELLLKHYQDESDTNNQIETIKSLLTVDSILNTNYKGLSKQIVKKYETPILISEKERLIKELENDKFLNKKTTIILIVLASILLLIAFYFFRRNSIYKKRFNNLLEEYSNESNVSKAKSINIEGMDSIDLPEELIKNVLKKLDKFEKTSRFTKKNYTLNSLAKELNTNSTYLSKIINITKKVNFANYLNDLKVEYAINQLTNDKHLRSYTIKAISEEVGFNNAQSFSAAFHKKTAIYPSYFIKQLENKKLK